MSNFNWNLRRDLGRIQKLFPRSKETDFPLLLSIFLLQIYVDQDFCKKTQRSRRTRYLYSFLKKKFCGIFLMSSEKNKVFVFLLNSFIFNLRTHFQCLIKAFEFVITTLMVLLETHLHYIEILCENFN